MFNRISTVSIPSEKKRKQILQSSVNFDVILTLKWVKFFGRFSLERIIAFFRYQIHIQKKFCCDVIKPFMTLTLCQRLIIPSLIVVYSVVLEEVKRTYGMSAPEKLCSIYTNGRKLLMLEKPSEPGFHETQNTRSRKYLNSFFGD